MTREEAITQLLASVKNVIWNNDWPTEDGWVVDDGFTCTCPLLNLIEFIEGEVNG